VGRVRTAAWEWMIIAGKKRRFYVDFTPEIIPRESEGKFA
jgi:hypothetical protein